jgi:hypothetical protein
MIALGLCIALFMPAARAFTEDAPDAAYVGGTVPGIKEGATGSLDMTPATELKFRAGSAEASIPYAEITKVEYREQNRFRLGVAATVVVGIVKARAKVHTVTITWTNDQHTKNVATLELSKERARTLLDVLNARAPSACTRGFNSNCNLPR